MKTKILGIVTMVTVLLMMLVSSVNAATITADKAEMAKEEIVTLTVELKEAAKSVQFDVEFDTDNYTYVDGSVKSDLGSTKAAVLADKSNVVRVSGFALDGETTTTVTLQFKAVENGENLAFTVSGTEFIGVDGEETAEAFENATITTTIADPVEEPEDPTEEPEDPTEEPDQKPDDEKPAEDPDKDDSGYYDEDGNPIEKLPQTGSMVPVVVAGVAILVVASLVVFKATRK